MKHFAIRMVTIFATTLALVSCFRAAYSDQLLIEAIRQEPPNTLEGLPRPHNGNTQREVFDAFGEPAAKSAPIGKPPITRWEYEEFTVVFEGDRVIKSVPKLITVPPDTFVEQQ